MIVNFRTRGISRGARKLTRISTLIIIIIIIIKKSTDAYTGMEEMLLNFWCTYQPVMLPLESHNSFPLNGQFARFQRVLN